MTLFDQAIKFFCLPVETEWAALPDGHMNESSIGSLNGQPKYVLRRYHRDRTPSDVEGEHKVLSAIRGALRVRVPKPLQTNESTSHFTCDNQSVAVFEYLAGRHPSLSTPQDVEAAAAALAAVHAALWAAREQMKWVTQARPPVRPDTWPTSCELRHNLERASIHVSTEFLTKVIQHAVESFNSLEPIQTTAHLIHGDVNASNLLVGGATPEVTAILDWDECRCDMPIYDISALMSCLADESLKAAAIKSYQNTLANTEHPYVGEMSKVRHLLPHAQTVNTFNELLIMLKSERHHPGYLEKLLTRICGEVE